VSRFMFSCRRWDIHSTRKYYRPVEPAPMIKLLADMNSLQLRNRIESEMSFSFSPTDSIHSAAMLLKVSH
jgi:hypothetical protein